MMAYMIHEHYIWSQLTYTEYVQLLSQKVFLLEVKGERSSDILKAKTNKEFFWRNFLVAD